MSAYRLILHFIYFLLDLYLHTYKKNFFFLIWKMNVIDFLLQKLFKLLHFVLIRICKVFLFFFFLIIKTPNCKSILIIFEIYLLNSTNKIVEKKWKRIILQVVFLKIIQNFISRTFCWNEIVVIFLEYIEFIWVFHKL